MDPRPLYMIDRTHKVYLIKNIHEHLVMLFTMIQVQAIVIFLFLIISLFSTCRIHATNDTDRLALLAFKHSIEDPQMALSSWNDSDHFCLWEGVTCGRRHHQRVTSLILQSKGLAGPLSPFVGNLSFLKFLGISNNSFRGEIPSELGRLSRLQSLSLNVNSFEGQFPANTSHCSKLVYLGVGSNKLVGKLPEELRALSRLTLLVVHLNYFTGTVPHFLGNLTSLESVSAAFNHFEGSIPDSISQLKNLDELGFGSNNLSGMIPPSLYNLSLLTTLSLGHNQLEGSLLPTIGSSLPHLQTFLLNDNQFTGSLPHSFSNCSDMKVLQVSGNGLSGKIGIDFGRINITRVILNNNSFGSGEVDEFNFIGSLANCSYLEILELGVNKLRWSLPNYVGNLSSRLDYLNLGKNLIYGRLPSTIGNLVGLSDLLLYDNQFTNTIPSSIGNLRKVQRVSFHNNRFSGTIQDSIGNLSLLLELYLDLNELEGIIPISLGNCKSLFNLDLSQNNLSGPIPNKLFRLSALSDLNFSRNHLHGSLPLEVGNLKKLGSLDLSTNDLSGEIPSSLGSCTSLENLFLDQNMFQGPIPSSLVSLLGITNLDLSQNNLSGHIPIFFEQFSMAYLNISFNNFEGDVPKRGVFANLSAMSVVGNNKLCGGMPELHLRKCSFDEPKKHGMSVALIIVISIISTILCVTTILLFFFCRRKTRREKLSGPLMKETFLRVSYEQLVKATSGFSIENLVGSGGFGSVYKGILDVNEVVVAVKVLNLQSRGACKSFMIECEALRNVRHRNLVKIITSCSSIDFLGNDFKALVYEFMPNGSLEEWLHSSQELQNEHGELQRLNLLQRINIAVDVACALDYLHYRCEKSIIHCDLKPSNILLDGDMVAHIGDFGLAKFLLPGLTDEAQSISIGLRGTIGYAPPEYGLGSEISTNGDVYSFGILLLEIIIGKRPTDDMFKEGLTLHKFASMALPDHVKDIADPLILENNEEASEAIETNSGETTRANKIEECLVSATKVGVACSMESPQGRMSITDAFHELNSVRNKIFHL